MAEAVSDKELVNRLRKGDNKAFECLVDRYSDKVFGLATRYLKAPEDAEEVLQDVFVTVYRKIDKFEGKSSFSSWLYRVTVNAALMKIRKRNQDRSISVEDLLPQIRNTISLKSATAESGESATARLQLLQQISDAINRLPDEYRPIFILRDIDGLTSREVSRILSLSVPAVKSRLHRSRLMLRRRLARVYQDFTDIKPRAGNM